MFRHLNFYENLKNIFKLLTSTIFTTTHRKNNYIYRFDFDIYQTYNSKSTKQHYVQHASTISWFVKCPSTNIVVFLILYPRWFCSGPFYPGCQKYTSDTFITMSQFYMCVVIVNSCFSQVVCSSCLYADVNVILDCFPGDLLNLDYLSLQ